MKIATPNRTSTAGLGLFVAGLMLVKLLTIAGNVVMGLAAWPPASGEIEMC